MHATVEAELMARSFEARIGDAERIVDPIRREVALQALQDEFEQLRKRIADGRAVALWERNILQGVSLRKMMPEVGLAHPSIQHFVDRGKLLADLVAKPPARRSVKEQERYGELVPVTLERLRAGLEALKGRSK